MLSYIMYAVIGVGMFLTMAITLNSINRMLKNKSIREIHGDMNPNNKLYDTQVFRVSVAWGVMIFIILTMLR